MIRTVNGRITYWSPIMEQRYGFAAKEALGEISHQLLRTSSWQPLDEIDAVLARWQSWNGGMIHHRADGQPVIVANYWKLHQDDTGAGTVVTEVHSDIVSAGTATAKQLADAMTTIAYELRQSVTALSESVLGAKRALQYPGLDRRQLTRGITAAIAEIDCASEAVDRVRALSETLRNPRSHELHARLAAVRADGVRMRAASRRTAADLSTLQATALAARQEGRRNGEHLRASAEAAVVPLHCAFAAQNIQVLERLLSEATADRSDREAEPMLRRILAQEKAKLAMLEQTAEVPRSEQRAL
jgi:hypothetical protein